MPNIMVALKEEISRLARKEIRLQMEGLKKASATHRRDIAALKRQVAKLERQVALLEGRVQVEAPVVPAEEEGTNVRFTAKGLRSQRKRLGMSAGDYSILVGVTPQSIYNWERGASRPRKGQIATLATLRGIGKKDALALLDELTKKKAPVKKRKPAAKKKAVAKKKAAAKKKG
jgi:predicted transcriptional regulator